MPKNCESISDLAGLLHSMDILTACDYGKDSDNHKVCQKTCDVGGKVSFIVFELTATVLESHLTHMAIQREQIGGNQWTED